jgi:membrane associated rhomboid family serine protease
MSDLTTSAQTSAGKNADELYEKGQVLLLREARAAEAAGTFAQILQFAPDYIPAHLGMAEANLALNISQVARQAAEYVIHHVPGTNDADLAQAILLTIDQRYDAAYDLLELLATRDPGRAYAHALRGHILRLLRRDYDASLAEAKASRLASSHEIRSLFPRPVQPQGQVMVAPTPEENQKYGAGENQQGKWTSPPAQSQWTPPSPVRRQQVRAQFFLSQYPAVTYTLIGLCVIAFMFQQVSPDFNFQGTQYNQLVPQQPWRIITAMFLHASIMHILVNMLTLWNLGSIVERIYGTSRFIAIYFIAGIVGGILFYVFDPTGAAVGASGAIFGVFGAFGAFFFAFRQQLGPLATSMLQQWAFWLVLNVIINVQSAVSGGILGWQAHLGGLLAGMALGFLLVPARRRS